MDTGAISRKTCALIVRPRCDEASTAVAGIVARLLASFGQATAGWRGEPASIGIERSKSRTSALYSTLSRRLAQDNTYR